MIKATFYKSNKSDKFAYVGFNIKGHSGYAEAGSDIVCASVSSMVMLFLNTVEGVFCLPFDLSTNEKNAEIDFKLKEYNENVSRAIYCLKECIESVAMDYPKYVKVL